MVVPSAGSPLARGGAGRTAGKRMKNRCRACRRMPARSQSERTLARLFMSEMKIVGSRKTGLPDAERRSTLID